MIFGKGNYEDKIEFIECNLYLTSYDKTTAWLYPLFAAIIYCFIWPYIDYLITIYRQKILNYTAPRAWKQKMMEPVPEWRLEEVWKQYNEKYEALRKDYNYHRLSHQELKHTTSNSIHNLRHFLEQQYLENISLKNNILRLDFVRQISSSLANENNHIPSHDLIHLKHFPWLEYTHVFSLSILTEKRTDYGPSLITSEEAVMEIMRNVRKQHRANEWREFIFHLNLMRLITFSHDDPNTSNYEFVITSENENRLRNFEVLYANFKSIKPEDFQIQPR